MRHKITFEKSFSEFFVTSDNHFFHKFMAAHRGFADVESMNKMMVHWWNHNVPDTATVLLFGDFSFGNREDTRAIVEQLNGEKFIIPGNHDDSKRIEYWFGADHVLPELTNVKVVDGDEQIRFVASHYPLASWNGSDKGSLHLHGHLHTKDNQPISHHFCAPYEGAGSRFDIGIDNAAWFGQPWAPIPIIIPQLRHEDRQVEGT